MHFTPSFNQTLRRRAMQLMALSGVIALAACAEDDITGPKKALMPPPSVMLSKEASDKLEELGSSLDDMTGWSLMALPDGKGRANIIKLLGGLKQNLTDKKIAACQQDIADARAFLGSLTEVEQVEIGHVNLALDVVQAALDDASK